MLLIDALCFERKGVQIARLFPEQVNLSIRHREILDDDIGSA